VNHMLGVASDLGYAIDSCVCDDVAIENVLCEIGCSHLHCQPR
jgi:hypothetical protein